MFKDVEYARRIYDQVVKRNLNAGVSGSSDPAFVVQRHPPPADTADHHGVLLWLAARRVDQGPRGYLR